MFDGKVVTYRFRSQTYVFFNPLKFSGTTFRIEK